MKTKKAKLAVAVLIGMGFAMQASAGPILNWDGESVITADDDLSFGTGTDQGLIRNFTPAGAILTSSAPGYSGNSIYSITQTENGGAAATGLDDSGGDRTDVAGGNSSLWIGVDGDSPSADQAIRSVASLVWFDLDTTPDAADYISAMDLGVSAAGGISETTLRFAVMSDGQWYVSTENLDQAAFSGGATTLAYAGADWASLSVADASSSSLMTAAGLTYNVAGTSLDNISAVGIFMEGTTASDTARARIKLGDLTADVIPEPATLGLIGAFGGAILFIRRRFMI